MNKQSVGDRNGETRALVFGARVSVAVVAGEGFEPSKLSRRIYSPLPLAARATRLFAVQRVARIQIPCT